jgi:hypothetical protein
LLAQLLGLIRQLVPSLRQHQLHHSATPEVAWHCKTSPHALGRELPIIIGAGSRLLYFGLITHDTTLSTADDKFILKGHHAKRNQFYRQK